MNQNLISLLLFFFIGFFIIPGVIADNQPENYHTTVSADFSEIKSGFEVRIVSPEILENVRNNYGSHGTPLRVERGLYIGFLAPGILYLRGDLNEEEFPLREISHENSKEKIGNHLIDIAFGRDNAKIDLFVKSPDYLIWLDTMYNQEDRDILYEYSKLLNDLSQTTRFEDEKIAFPSYLPNYYPNPYTHYRISIVEKGYLKKKLDDRDISNEQVLKDEKGQVVALVRNDHLHLLNDLQKDERKHFLIRGLLFSMGFHGESLLPDSFFNPENTCQVHLSELDKEVISLMYGGRLHSGIDVEGIRKALDLKLKN